MAARSVHLLLAMLLQRATFTNAGLAEAGVHALIPYLWVVFLFGGAQMHG